MALAPIWKDRAVTLDTATYADYEIRTGDSSGPVIYQGRAYARPGEADVVARINDICAPFLGAGLPDFGSRFTPMQVSETFVTLVGGSVVDTITFYNDWSYDAGFTADVNEPLSDPIIAELDPRQWLVFSVLSGAQAVSVVLTFADGTTATISVPVAFSADFNDDFNGDYATEDDPGRSGTAVLDLSQFSDVVSVEFMGVTLPVRQTACAKFAVYYTNAYGGWDSLLLDGQDALTDNLTRHTIKRDYDNTDLDGRGIKDYALEISPEWTLRTGILTDEQSWKMAHLLNSVEVYLCDLGSGAFRPVVLTDTSAARQTYASNGRRPNQYTFTARLAQERIRR